jgi:hypothetical protein
VISGENKDTITFVQNGVSMPLSQAQMYAKQINALRLKRGLPALRVPGEDQRLGATPDNPYPAKNNLDIYSRAADTWLRLPNGKITHLIRGPDGKIIGVDK